MMNFGGLTISWSVFLNGSLSYHARARMASVITAIAHRLVASMKSVNEVVREYQNVLENMVVDAANGLYKNRRSTFVKTMQQLIIDDAQSVYIEGLLEGGRKPPELDEDDERAIREWTLSQTRNVGAFADDAMAVALLKGDERTAARNGMLERVKQWADSLAWLGRLAGLNATDKDPYLTYDGDDGQESCPECQKYKGKRKRKSAWEKLGLLARNGNPNFTCGRWENCHHNYYNDAGDEVL